jgi:hypothetical protein
VWARSSAASVSAAAAKSRTKTRFREHIATVRSSARRSFAFGNRAGELNFHMGRQAKRALGICYVLTLVFPFIVSGLNSQPVLSAWLRTGNCPGGPMDRPEQVCDPFTFFFVVFLGGWFSWIVLPLLGVWWVGSTLAFRSLLKRFRHL